MPLLQPGPGPKSTTVSPSLRLRLRVTFAAMLFCAASLTASASPILYTLSGIFSGSLGSTSFTDQQATFSLLSDTSFVQAQNGGFFSNTTGVSSFQLANGTSALFLSPTFGVESEYGAASFLDGLQNFAAGEYNESTPYNILSDLGVLVTGAFVSYGATPALTSRGDLALTGATGDVTFSTAAPNSVTPEPGSLLLSGTGLLGLASTLRRRSRPATHHLSALRRG